jgi:hypothetical protein
MAERLIEGSWLKAYLAYTAESESPEEYHLWTGISVIAGALQRKVFFDMGYFLLYPNMYIILVGPPGRCKKSTAMRIGRDILKQVPGAKFTADSTTREKLIINLAQAHKDGISAMTAHSTEFATMLTSSGMDMVVFLTDIFDCPPMWEHDTKSGGKNTIKGPFFNLEGATTPDWISRAMPLDTIGVGLTSRIIFVHQDTPREADAIPKLTEAQKALAGLLITDLIAISTLSGEFKLTEDAYKHYNDWYRARVGNPNPSGDPRLAGYFERKPMHMLKLSMILAASKRDGLWITLEDIIDAEKTLERIEARMPKVFVGVGRNTLHADKEEILLALVQAFPGGLSMGELLVRFSYALRKDELAEVLDVLVMTGQVVLKANKYTYIPRPEE